MIDIELLIHTLTKACFCGACSYLASNIVWQLRRTQKYCSKATFTDLKHNLEPWLAEIDNYNTNIINIIDNKQQLILPPHKNDDELTDFHKSGNNNFYIKLSKINPCHNITLRDEWHLQNCTNINSVSFFVPLDSQHSYMYRIDYFYCKFQFKRYKLQNESAYHNGFVINNISFTSSEEMFKDFEKERIMALFT